ncbi:hypothetical protein M8J76_010345 [Diaphorina citri]|nr:hypothetical protein M8J75_001362 [Diaphorina citri]KAI5723745.1 hypothetical protein M8J76_010345 [Diaphorina citri]KAI5728693.1 hypothetical protein M8J77_019721 [Diaphorina citri]
MDATSAQFVKLVRDTSRMLGTPVRVADIGSSQCQAFWAANGISVSRDMILETKVKLMSHVLAMCARVLMSAGRYIPGPQDVSIQKVASLIAKLNEGYALDDDTWSLSIRTSQNDHEVIVRGSINFNECGYGPRMDVGVPKRIGANSYRLTVGQEVVELDVPPQVARATFRFRTARDYYMAGGHRVAPGAVTATKGNLRWMEGTLMHAVGGETLSFRPNGNEASIFLIVEECYVRERRENVSYQGPDASFLRKFAGQQAGVIENDNARARRRGAAWVTLTEYAALVSDYTSTPNSDLQCRVVAVVAELFLALGLNIEG